MRAIGHLLETTERLCRDAGVPAPADALARIHAIALDDPKRGLEAFGNEMRQAHRQGRLDQDLIEEIFVYAEPWGRVRSTESVVIDHLRGIVDGVFPDPEVEIVPAFGPVPKSSLGAALRVVR